MNRQDFLDSYNRYGISEEDICPSRIDLTFLTTKAKEYVIRGNNDK